jgi:hypothetical protein
MTRAQQLMYVEAGFETDKQGRKVATVGTMAEARALQAQLRG